MDVSSFRKAMFETELSDIIHFLPIRRNQPEDDYIRYLWEVCGSLNTETTAKSFTLMPFHLLFMLSLQYKSLRLADLFPKSVEVFFAGVGGKELVSSQRSVFDISRIKESTLPEIFRLVELSQGDIKLIKNLVTYRNNNLGHANGSIEPNPIEKLRQYIDTLITIQRAFTSTNQDLARAWLQEIQEDDDLTQFIEIRLLETRLTPWDFPAISSELLISQKLTPLQKEHIMQMTAGFAENICEF